MTDDNGLGMSDGFDLQAEPRLVSLLEALTAPSGPDPLPGERQALTTYRASVLAHRRPPHRNPLRRPRMLVHTAASKLTAAAMAGGLVLTGTAAVASGSLPSEAQQAVSDVFSRVGIEVPGPDEHAGSHPEGRGDGERNAGGKGSEVSDLATTTDETGRDKGAQISDLASDGQSQAGEHGGADTGREAADEDAQATTPSAGGATSGDEASSGAGTAGAAIVEKARDGAGDGASDGAGDAHADDGAGNAGGPR